MKAILRKDIHYAAVDGVHLMNVIIRNMTLYHKYYYFQLKHCSLQGLLCDLA